MRLLHALHHAVSHQHNCGRAACKFLDASGTGALSDAIRCFEYCASEGAHIVSNSWGQYSSSAALQVCRLPPAHRQMLDSHTAHLDTLVALAYLLHLICAEFCEQPESSGRAGGGLCRQRCAEYGHAAACAEHVAQPKRFVGEQTTCWLERQGPGIDGLPSWRNGIPAADDSCCSVARWVLSTGLAPCGEAATTAQRPWTSLHQVRCALVSQHAGLGCRVRKEGQAQDHFGVMAVYACSGAA